MSGTVSVIKHVQVKAVLRVQQLGAKTKWTNYKIADLLKEVKIKRNKYWQPLLILCFKGPFNDHLLTE
jgi:hypothetical protein